MSTNVNDLVVAQDELAAHITRALSNYKKSKSKITKAYVDTRLELLEQDFQLFKINHLEIQKLATPEQKKNLKYFKEDRYYNCEDEYLELKTLMKEFLNEHSEQGSTSRSVEAASVVKVKSCLKTKLPPIEIPSFSGNYDEFTSFYDLFKSLIHNNNDLSKIQKYHYLKSNLKGEAEILLRQFPLTEANYEKALELLEARYDNKRLIVHSHITRLLNQKKIPSESASGIRALLDTTSECLYALQNIGVPTTNWDPIIIHLTVSKLDIDSHRLWEQQLGSSRELPTMKELFDFMEMRFRTLEAMKISVAKENTPKPRQTLKAFKADTEPFCSFCSKDHYIQHCKEFGKLKPEERRDVVKEKQLCFNCLIPKHSVRFCRQSTSCRICNRRHHSLLHLTTPIEDQAAHIAHVENNTDDQQEQEHTPVLAMTAHKTEIKASQVLLATALVRVLGRNGKMHTLRALIDQGSEASFISNSAAQRLGLHTINICSKIRGVDANITMISEKMVELNIYSIYDDKVVIQTKAHLLKNLSTIIPRKEAKVDFGSHLKGLRLADPNFIQPSGIDILLGADVYANILLEGLKKYNTLIAQNSRLGWFISGKINEDYSGHVEVLSMHSQLETEDLLQRFWESEELFTETRKQTANEIECEKIFKETYTRTSTGRYVVALPFSSEISTPLGQSRDLAVKRFMQMERRFIKDTKLQEYYKDFMKEYETLGHMEKVPDNELQNSNVYYLPHHGILKEDRLTTKLRVVFDGSAKTSTGVSLNDKLLIGPSLQHDIRDLFLRWRTHKICLVADMQRMYRQILIREVDRDYQRIVWRENPGDPITEYRLITVTYGTSCAPYLAIKVLRQLACDERLKFPKAAEVLESDLYMDDLMSGCDTEEEAVLLCKDLIDITKNGGFVLHKWGSNSKLVLDSLPKESNQPKESHTIILDASVKALGIKWNLEGDYFELSTSYSNIDGKLTKRAVLSNIAKMYDPLGWLSPVVVVAKMFLQKLWLLGLGWDDDLPESYQTEWITYKNELNAMTTIQLPRWIGLTKTNTRVELHGFSDASTLAYAGVVYVRIFDQFSDIIVKLVTAKTKVAPVKQISVPKLELCGAVLTAKLLHRVKQCLNVLDDCVYAWTDSTIVLAWLQKHPNSWKPFVGNRVSEILGLTYSHQWHHVSTLDNPADCASRGVSPTQLPEHELWWKGPKWLQLNNELDLTVKMHETGLEQRITVHNLNLEGIDEWLIDSFSNLTKLQRIVGYCLRFIKKCRLLVQNKQGLNTNEIDVMPLHLSTSELRQAMYCCVKISQRVYFFEEFNKLSNDFGVSKKSPLYFLRPFLDSNELIRVGGRLKNAPIPQDVKHPIVVSGKSHLAKLIIDQTHKRTLHGGPLLMLNIIRTKFWVTNVKSLVKRHVKNCVICDRNAPKFATQLMGNLPSVRVTVSKPFCNSGVDFAGPCYLKTSKLRNSASTKAYIAVFICTSTKAIHLELVSELSTSAFIAAFKRFCARRGHCANLYSDCGTNFIGANFELSRMLTRAKSSLPIELSELLANDSTEWHFIPPGSPHFGGLWESGVRSVKHHINRVLGNTKLTFEEYATLLAQIECCLNSRPISAMSDSVDDYTALTPGHFLVFGPPVVVPNENVLDVPINRLNRWQHIEHMLQSFWQRWQQEYLTTLQNRYKWTTTERPVKVNDLVVIKNECLPPSKWALGRVIYTHPGNDGHVRVVTVKCQNAQFKRPITKLCLLPIDSS